MLLGKNLDEKTLKELNAYSDRVDVDLSALTFDENLEFNDVVAYYNQKKSYFAFSGRHYWCTEGSIGIHWCFWFRKAKEKRR